MVMILTKVTQLLFGGGCLSLEDDVVRLLGMGTQFVRQGLNHQVVTNAALLKYQKIKVRMG